MCKYEEIEGWRLSNGKTIRETPNRDMINFQLVKEGISNANTYCHVSDHTLQQYR